MILVRLTKVLTAAIAVTAIAGCDAALNIRTGEKPNIQALEQTLQLRQSTTADVRGVLGEPYGRGRMMFPGRSEPRDLWTYYYEEGSTKDARRTMLWVSFDREGHYDGYMWFSSLPQ